MERRLQQMHLISPGISFWNRRMIHALFQERQVKYQWPEPETPLHLEKEEGSNDGTDGGKSGDEDTRGGGGLFFGRGGHGGLSTSGGFIGT